MLILATLSGIQDFLFDLDEAGGWQARALRAAAKLPSRAATLPPSGSSRWSCGWNGRIRALG
jgi:hypothetical protein